MVNNNVKKPNKKHLIFGLVPGGHCAKNNFLHQPSRLKKSKTLKGDDFK